MPISDIKKQYYKTVFVFLGVSLFSVILEKGYWFFGHKVTSPYMTWLFLYPLVGGALFYYLISCFLPECRNFAGYRLFFNLYNSGISILVVGSFMNGIFEIAGTSSPYTTWYYIIGTLFLTFGIGILLFISVKQHIFSAKNNNDVN